MIRSTSEFDEAWTTQGKLAAKPDAVRRMIAERLLLEKERSELVDLGLQLGEVQRELLK